MFADSDIFGWYHLAFTSRRVLKHDLPGQEPIPTVYDPQADLFMRQSLFLEILLEEPWTHLLDSRSFLPQILW